MRILVLVVAAVVCLLSVPTFAGDLGFDVPGGGPGGNAPKPVNWNEAEYVFTAKLENVIEGPTAQSFPPIYNHTLNLTVDKVLRGELKPKEKLAAHNAAHQTNAPIFPVGKICLVAANKAQGTLSILRIEEADDAKIADVEKLCALPIGWKLSGGKVVSPWAALGKKWPEGVLADVKVKCDTTGRPALLLGSGVKLEVEAVIPKPDPANAHPEWTNPDGDGEYKVTLTNTTDKPVTVPALLSDGKKILWDDSLVILCQGKAYTVPGSKGITEKVEAATLKPNESVSTVINALRLKGPEWPQGGYRIEFQICLGEKSQSKSFYYLSKHHDPIRDALRREKK